MKWRDGVPDVVYAESREHAQKLLDESYLAKFKAVPCSEWKSSCAANAALTKKLAVAEAGLVAAREALQADPEKWSYETLLTIAELILARDYGPAVFPDRDPADAADGDIGPWFVRSCRAAIRASRAALAASLPEGQETT